jgi:hypothetical protein
MKTIRTFYVDKILGRDLDKIIEFSKIKCKEHASEQSGGHYRHNHWGSESNMLFHVRHQEFKDADGKSVFFVEEIQSDWHQEGRKKGYKGGFKAEIKHEFPGDKFPYRVYIGGEKISAHETEDEAKASASDIEPRWNQNNGVPDAPMKKSWEENAFKYSLQQAVESGCDRIGWVTGDIAAERFDLSKQLDSVSAQKNPDGTYHIYGFKGESQILSHDSKEEDLDEVVGKEMAKKINEAKDNNTLKDITTLYNYINQHYDSNMTNSECLEVLSKSKDDISSITDCLLKLEIKEDNVIKEDILYEQLNVDILNNTINNEDLLDNNDVKEE